jgi:NADH-quinone oxidoreductase subunit J
MSLTIVVLSMTLAAALWTVITPGLIRAVLGLAVTSVLVTILMFMLGAGLAAVFELSVCAGLITVVFVSTVSMTQPSPTSALMERTRSRLRRYWLLPIIMVAAGAALAYFSLGAEIATPPPIPPADAREVLWGQRQTDILGQVIVLLAGILGVAVLFKERKK